MTRTRSLLAALAVAALTALTAGPALADDSGDDPMALAQKGAEQIIDALRLLIASIPQYEMPEILPNGDIIIRRVHPNDEGQPTAPDAPQQQPDDGTAPGTAI